MIKRSRTKAAAQAPMHALPVAALVHVTGGNPSVEVPPVPSMREIVHIQARK
jgi:hypothetical protein